MGIKLPKLFGRARDEPRDMMAATPVDMYFFGSSASGKKVSPYTAMQTTAVYACVKVIAETVASLPLHVYRKADRGQEKATDEKLYWLLHNEPNHEMSSYTWRETIMTHLLLWGNSYNQTVHNYRDELIGLYPLMPWAMDVERAGNGEVVYKYTDSDGKVHKLGTDEVLHIPGLGFDGLIGYSPIAMERNALGLAISAEEYGSKFFQNGARPSGVLTHPGVMKDPSRVRESWAAAYGGSGNSGKTAVLEEGMQYKPISMPNSEAQFLETRKFQVSEICRIYRVPPHMIGDLEHATFSNIEHQGISFGVHTIRPWLVRIEQALDRKLVPEDRRRELWTGFNMDGLLRGDYKSRMEGYAIGLQNGFMSPNDIRRMENWNLIPAEEGGDDYLLNGNMIKLKDAGAAYTSGNGGAGDQE